MKRYKVTAVRKALWFFLFTLGIAGASGCQTVQPLTVITSTPTGALVKIEGFGECETPCSIQHDDYRNITVAKAGYTTQKFRVKPGAGAVNVILKLAAPTEGVDEAALPEL